MFKEIFFAIIVIGVVSTMAAASSTGIEIQTPQDADILKGSVEVKGSISETDFVSASLYYAYSDPEVETWFLIGSIQKPVDNGLLAKWDTSSISDGNYKLKLSVFRKTGEIQEVIVDHLQVRNYTPAQVIVPTATVQEIVEITPTVVPEQPIVAATNYPPNQASATSEDVSGEIKNGLILGVFSILAFGIYTAMRGWLYRR